MIGPADHASCVPRKEDDVAAYAFTRCMRRGAQLPGRGFVQGSNGDRLSTLLVSDDNTS